MMPEAQVAAIRAAAPAGVTVERHRADFRQLLAQTVLSISQAGYNTVLDLLQTRPRMVLVPFAAGGETEQTVRAKLLADKNLATVVPEAGLTPERLAAAVDAALEAVRPEPPPIDFDGGANAARALKQWVAERNH
jgi:predicted glycosyltransferase